MNKCERIETLLWSYGNLTETERAEIDEHLQGCVSCREAFATIGGLQEAVNRNRASLAEIDAAKFDSAVMAKIRTERKPLVKPAVDSRGYKMRLAFSFAMAAMIVLFLVKSISDLGPIDTFNQASRESEPKAARDYGLINLEMKSGEKAEIPASSSIAKTSPAEEEVFSILLAPVTAPSPESVNIGAVFVSNENIPLARQSLAASLADVYVDTGVAQAAMPQSSMLVTVEKMPKAIHMAVPEYPVWARKRGYSGTVWIKARVESDGSVSEADVISCDMPNLGFEEASLKAALQSEFQPASSNGISFAVSVIYPVKFVFMKK